MQAALLLLAIAPGIVYTGSKKSRACGGRASRAERSMERVAVNYHVVETIKKGISYDWKDSIIVNLVKRKYGVKVTSQCVRHFRSAVPCPASCRVKCWMDQ